jgi:RNA recognition motif-containing protein
MDALLQELEAEKNSKRSSSNNSQFNQYNNNNDQRGGQFVPEKKGSFVEPGEEKLTSNLFVGNLAPSITEEDLSNLFSQFGENTQKIKCNKQKLHFLWITAIFVYYCVVCVCVIMM